MSSLPLILLLLGTSVLAIVGCRRLGLPPMLGYLFVGSLLGPHAFNLMQSVSEARHLAEFGVVFLMFTIGLEFSYRKLFAMKHLVLGLGGLQMLTTLIVITLIAMAFGLSWQIGVTIGGIVATASTAVLSKYLAERSELESPHGKEVIGVLLFQDLAVVPLLIFLPALNQPPEHLAFMLLTATLKAAAVLILIFVVGSKLIGGWLRIVAASKSPEVFVLNILLMTLGLAFLTDLAGLSLALGAFIAGMLIAETDFRLQVEEDIKPFRDVLMGLFFVTIGFYMDVASLIKHWLAIAMTLFAILLVKGVIAWLASRLLGGSKGTALRSALWLCTGGEFGFVILAQMQSFMPHDIRQVLLSALILSMLLAPLIIAYSERIVLKLVAGEWQMRSLLLTQNVAKTMGRRDHIVLCGFGRSGQYLSRLLEAEGYRTLAVDLDRDRLKEASNPKDAFYGDATRRDTLRTAGFARAKVMLISVGNPRVALRIIEQARRLSTETPIVVRTYDDTYLEELIAAGANEVIPEYLEGSWSMAAHALLLSGVSFRRVLSRIRAARSSRYRLMRDHYSGLGETEPTPAEGAPPASH